MKFDFLSEVKKPEDDNDANQIAITVYEVSGYLIREVFFDLDQWYGK